VCISFQEEKKYDNKLSDKTMFSGNMLSDTGNIMLSDNITLSALIIMLSDNMLSDSTISADNTKLSDYMLSDNMLAYDMLSYNIVLSDNMLSYFFSFLETSHTQIPTKLKGHSHKNDYEIITLKDTVD
jgi:hypothetical protein